MVRAVRAQELARGRSAALALTATAVLGAIFLALQALVWVGLWRQGLVPSGGPYPSVFYAFTAFHALHVLVGLGALAWLALRARARDLVPDGRAALGLVLALRGRGVGGAIPDRLPCVR